MSITYIDRKTGEKCVEKVYGQRALCILYGDGFFNTLFSKICLPIIACLPFSSWVFAFFKKRSRSRKEVAPFIRAYGIDESEFIENKFSSFNDFFIRKLKKDKRPIETDPNVATMPADGRYLVYPQFDDFVIKGKEFSIREFLSNCALSHRYADGSMAIARLCPSDYHRFHFICDGVPSKPSLINGPLYSVNPIALKKRLSILSENKRMITEIETERFGTVLYIEIGATTVGSIHQTFPSSQKVQKGDEKGYFEFGGSCIVLLFERDRVVFDADLVKNTQDGFETRANFGESLAKGREFYPWTRENPVL